MKKFIFVAVCALISVFGYIKAEQGDYDTLGYSTPGGYSFWRVNSAGAFTPGIASTLDIGTAALPVKTIYVGTVTGTGALSATAISATSVVSTGKIGLASKSIAQLKLITPVAIGELYICNDCSPLEMAMSTGTVIGAFGNASGAQLN